jgi:hypothetical protein
MTTTPSIRKLLSSIGVDLLTGSAGVVYAGVLLIDKVQSLRLRCIDSIALTKIREQGPYKLEDIPGDRETPGVLQRKGLIRETTVRGVSGYYVCTPFGAQAYQVLSC